MRLAIRALALWACMGAPAFAQVGMGVLPFGGAVASGPTFGLAYQSSAGSSDTTHTTVDFGPLSYGSGNTRVIVVIEWVTGTIQTVTDVTIGSTHLAQVSGAHIVQGGGGSGANGVDVWESTGPLAGSSDDVQVTFGATTGFSSAVALYKLVTTTPTAGTPATGIQNFGATASAGPVSVPMGGGAIVALMTGNGTTISSYSNATSDAVVNGNYNFAHSTATGSITVTGNIASNDTAVISVVPWGP